MTRKIALAVQLALVMGQRVGEVVGIVKSELHIDARSSLWIIPKARTKSKREHRMPLSSLAIRLIGEAEKLSGDSAFLFPGVGRFQSFESEGGVFRRLVPADIPINSEVVTKAWSRSRDSLRLSDVRVHDLRRTVASLMAAIGISPFVIGLVLNHAAERASTITQRVYNQYTYDAEKRDALERWTDHLQSNLDGPDA